MILESGEEVLQESPFEQEGGSGEVGTLLLTNRRILFEVLRRQGAIPTIFSRGATSTVFESPLTEVRRARSAEGGTQGAVLEIECVRGTIRLWTTLGAEWVEAIVRARSEPCPQSPPRAGAVQRPSPRATRDASPGLGTPGAE